MWRNGNVWICVIVMVWFFSDFSFLFQKCISNVIKHLKWHDIWSLLRQFISVKLIPSLRWCCVKYLSTPSLGRQFKSNVYVCGKEEKKWVKFYILMTSSSSQVEHTHLIHLFIHSLANILTCMQWKLWENKQEGENWWWWQQWDRWQKSFER